MYAPFKKHRMVSLLFFLSTVILVGNDFFPTAPSGTAKLSRVKYVPRLAALRYAERGREGGVS